MPLLGGVRPPIASLIALLPVIAAVTAVAVGGIRAERVPQAVVDGERQIAADTALSVGTSIGAEAGTVRRTVEAYTATGEATPATVLKALASARKQVLGSALLDSRTGRPLAADGEPVPLTGVDVTALASGHGAIPPRLVTSGGERRLLYFAKVRFAPPGVDANEDQAEVRSRSERQWLLVVSGALPALTAYGDGRSAEMLDAVGHVLGRAGRGTTSPAAADGGLPAAVARAAKRPGHRIDASASLPSTDPGGERTVVGWAQVAAATGRGDTDGLGLTVLTSRAVPTATATATDDYTRVALTAAGALTGLALLLGWVLRRTVQRPLLRLYLSAGRLARGAAGRGPGAFEELARPVPVDGFGESARVGRALESLRRQLLGESGPQSLPAPRGPGYRTLTVAAVLLLAGWSVPMIFLLNRVDTATAVPAAVVADQQARTEIVSNRIRRSLDQSYTDVGELAARLAGKSRAARTEVLRRALADRGTYRSLYLLNSSGDITLRVGDTPLRTSVHLPGGSGIATVNTSGRIPAIVAYARVPAGPGRAAPAGAVLFGEVDVNVLNSLLARPKLGSVWMTDGDDKVLAASVGYRAFQALPDSGLAGLARATRGAPGTVGSANSAVLASSAGPSVDAAAPVAQSGPAARLGWHVVTAEPAAALRLPATQARQRTMAVGILGLTVGAACLGWLHVVVIRPLRAVALAAERLAGGDRRTVLYPVFHDEVGSVARSLELIRQALAQRGRAGGYGRAVIPSQSRYENRTPW
ncbi:HAMP domain-containing protein [Streptomyces sp. NPDC018347]|uniref:HAMP domain-containing protein n=1 Tax=Streptomyces sp. NPDC018347 TaxID=3157193 RepID=UPI0033E05B80